jgi:uncharacterized protein YjiS (DUF1127 family)
MILLGLVRLVARAFDRFVHLLALRRTGRELYLMPDYLLKDMGITRSSISYVVAHGRNEVTLVDDGVGDERKRALPEQTIELHQGKMIMEPFPRSGQQIRDVTAEPSYQHAP